MQKKIFLYLIFATISIFYLSAKQIQRIEKGDITASVHETADNLPTIAECDLPLDYLEWIHWTIEKGDKTPNDNDRYHLYDINKNPILNNIYNSKNSDTIAYTYLKIKNNKDFDSYVVALADELSTFYKLLNISKNGTYNELLIGEELDGLWIRFNIDESLNIKLTKEEIAFDEATKWSIPTRLLSETHYQITEDGKIIKIQ